MVPNQKVKDLASRLKGTCDGAVDEISELTLEECQGLDLLVGCCEGCGWWHSRHDLNDDWLCPVCAPTDSIQS